MGTSKSDLFSYNQNDIANSAKAFAHPARVAIIHHLLKTNSCINGELVQELGLAQATISQHLKELKTIGIIKGTIEGASVNYCIDAERWYEVKEQFISMFDQFASQDTSDCC